METATRSVMPCSDEIKCKILMEQKMQKGPPTYLMLWLILVTHVSPLSNCHAMEDHNTEVCIKKQYPIYCY
jgi:hypothetical protein